MSNPVTERPSDRTWIGPIGLLLPDDQEKGIWLAVALPLVAVFFVVGIPLVAVWLIGALS